MAVSSHGNGRRRHRAHVDGNVVLVTNPTSFRQLHPAFKGAADGCLAEGG